MIGKGVFTIVLSLLGFIGPRPLPAHPEAAKKLLVVTSLQDLAAIAREIGGKYIEVFSIAKGYQDPHFVDPKPSFMVKLQRADMFIQAGLGLEIGWVPPLLDGARNPNILPGSRGYVDASKNVPLLQVPTGDPATLRARGDIHPYGNPHYWLDPLRGKIIADNIFEGLARLLPGNKETLQRNLARFKKTIDAKVARWVKMMAPYKGKSVVAFHNSWPYFEQRFGIKVVAFIEPKPGIPPTPKHLVKVIRIMKERRVKVIIISPYFSRKSAELLASKTGASVIELAPSVGAFPEIQTYTDLFDYNLSRLVKAFHGN